MPSSGMLRRVAVVRTDVSKDCRASIIRITRIGELGTLAVTSNRLFVAKNYYVRITLMKEALSSFESSVLTIATRRNIPEDTILHAGSSPLHELGLLLSE
jgi:demethoxyubiquinone hydroxylase (CLK1/Coq7/Cat5 family)